MCWIGIDLKVFFPKSGGGRNGFCREGDLGYGWRAKWIYGWFFKGWFYSAYIFDNERGSFYMAKNKSMIYKANQQGGKVLVL